MSWYQARDDGWVLVLHVQPGARTTEVAGLHGEALKIRLAAPPVDGKANAALCRFLAGALGVPVAAVDVLAGAGSRHKRVFIRGGQDPACLLPP